MQLILNILRDLQASLNKIQPRAEIILFTHH